MLSRLLSLFDSDPLFLKADRLGNARSGQWPAVRARHLARFPQCAVCGKTVNITVHHLRPFHLHPELELEPGNLLTLCEGKVVNCHLFIGHLLNWTTYNPKAVEHAAQLRAAILHRQG